MNQKFLIFDAGPLISLTMNGLLPILEKLKKEFNGDFILTPSVKRECIDRPLNIRKYELEALNIQNLLEKGVLTQSSKYIPNNKLLRETHKIMKNANTSFVADEKIQLIHEGEAACLAFSKLCKCENVIVMDERTTRLLIENPGNLKKLMERKLHTHISVKTQKLKNFENYKIIRSSELLFLAYKKNLFEIKKDKKLIDALMYGLKYKGTAISSREIDEMKNLA